MNSRREVRALEYTAAPTTLEAIVEQHLEIKKELEFLRESVKNAGTDATRANERIDRLEARMDELSRQISAMSQDIGGVKSEVVKFGPRQEAFMQNQWKLIFNLILLLGILITIIGGLAGVKVVFPDIFM